MASCFDYASQHAGNGGFLKDSAGNSVTPCGSTHLWGEGAFCAAFASHDKARACLERLRLFRRGVRVCRGNASKIGGDTCLVRQQWLDYISKLNMDDYLYFERFYVSQLMRHKGCRSLLAPHRCEPIRPASCPAKWPDRGPVQSVGAVHSCKARSGPKH